MLAQIAYYLTHPQAVIYTIATGLLYPAIYLEVVALAIVVFELGKFTTELVSRRGKRSVQAMEVTAYDARNELVAGRPNEALAHLRGLAHSQNVRSFMATLQHPTDLHRTKLMKKLDDLELTTSRHLERTRLLVRVAPVVGLITTLIPISPALVGLAKGDIQTLSNNLVIAFSTTVVGLLIGGVAYVISLVRDRLYRQDISDIEYVLDLLWQ